MSIDFMQIVVLVQSKCIMNLSVCINVWECVFVGVYGFLLIDQETNRDRH